MTGGTERCILCGHEGHAEDGETDNVGDWYCETCLDVAPSGEKPLLTDGGTDTSGVKRIEECAVCGEEVEIGGFPPEYYFPIDQSGVPSHKVQMAPNPSGELACSYGCLQSHEERNGRSVDTETEQNGGEDS